MMKMTTMTMPTLVLTMMTKMTTMKMPTITMMTMAITMMTTMKMPTMTMTTITMTMMTTLTVMMAKMMMIALLPANAHIHNLLHQLLFWQKFLPVENSTPSLPLLSSSSSSFLFIPSSTEREGGRPGTKVSWVVYVKHRRKGPSGRRGRVDGRSRGGSCVAWPRPTFKPGHAWPSLVQSRRTGAPSFKPCHRATWSRFARTTWATWSRLKARFARTSLGPPRVTGRGRAHGISEREIYYHCLDDSSS